MYLIGSVFANPVFMAILQNKTTTNNKNGLCIHIKGKDREQGRNFMNQIYA